tara:strand:+ start:3372 stop:4160 length:789 start_codon:yes stop_codon:yes gene_type:complete
MEDNSKQGKPVVTVYPAGSDDKSQSGELMEKAAGVATVAGLTALAIASGDADDLEDVESLLDDDAVAELDLEEGVENAETKLEDVPIDLGTWFLAGVITLFAMACLFWVTTASWFTSGNEVKPEPMPSMSTRQLTEVYTEVSEALSKLSSADMPVNNRGVDYQMLSMTGMAQRLPEGWRSSFVLGEDGKLEMVRVALPEAQAKSRDLIRHCNAMQNENERLAREKAPMRFSTCTPRRYVMITATEEMQNRQFSPAVKVVKDL